ncbi:MAG: sugar ABC transporter ATP-binding protein [Planctomycetota bacterium]
MDAAENVLSVASLTKRYATTVLDRCDFAVRSGEIHALLGANGAGKSTLCKIIAGLVPATSGSMSIQGVAYTPNTKQQAETRGVQIVQQELELIPTLSVAENVFFGIMPSTLGVIRRRTLFDRARDALDRVGLHDVRVDVPVGSLGIGRQQMVEIAKALNRDCKLLILDEPTAALSAAETETLFHWLRRLRKAGVGMIYISHRLQEVAEISDRVTVLRDGRQITTVDTPKLSTEKMVELMSGESTATRQTDQYRSYATTRPALRVHGLSSASVKDISLTVYRGERLGIAGLVGSGRTELLRAIFGADQCYRGHLFLPPSEAPIRFRHPSQAVAAGMAMVTEDRKSNGLLMTQSVRNNTTLNSLWQQFSNLGILHHTKESSVVNAMCASTDTRCNSIEDDVATLSGGNQQKVAVSKWLVRDSSLLLFDEPTRGIDVAARRRIYEVLESLAKAQKAMMIVSSDLDELLQICDRIAVMSAGRLVEVFDRETWSDDAIMRAAFAGDPGALISSERHRM